jgi:hypothetical protein
MKKIVFLFSFLLFVKCVAQAQNKSMGRTYQTALGVKIFDGGGITLKHFVSDKAALEGIGYFWSRGARVTGLYELHFDINNAPGLRWYVGPGAHIGFYNRRYYNNGNRNFYDGGTYLGIDGVLGLDYKINKAPLNLSVDWQPSIEFGTGRGFTGNWGGFGIRYTF